jgi:hypothetical protein
MTQEFRAPLTKNVFKALSQMVTEQFQSGEMHSLTPPPPPTSIIVTKDAVLTGFEIYETDRDLVIKITYDAP